MAETDAPLHAGCSLLEEVARRYAAGHGLRPDKVEWVQQYEEWWLTVSTADHSVKVVFSRDEIEDFVEDGPGSKGSKVKIRNAFASLSM